MKLLMIEDYSDFECIGDKCQICCCGGGWDIIVDDDSAKKYRAVEGEFGDELRKCLIDRNGKTYFVLDERKECPFLNEQGLCRIYRTLGEDALCNTCKTYPRSSYQVGDVIFFYLTTSCPEVTRRIIERYDPVQIDFSETPNNKMQEIKLKKMNWVKFNGAIEAYSTGMNILQDRSIDILARIRLLMLFIHDYEDNVRNRKSNKELFEKFSTDEGLRSFCNILNNHKGDWSLMTGAFSFIFSLVMGQSYDHPMWKKLNEMTISINSHGLFDTDAMQNALTCLDQEEIQIELEQIITYRYFKTFMSGYDNNDHYELMVNECVLLMALVFYIVIYKVLYNTEPSQDDRILYYSLCSRGDHSSITKESLKTWIADNGLYDFDRLMLLCSPDTNTQA